MQNTSDRFNATVQDYLRYRPSYPKEVLELLVAECDLTKNKIIADIGSGTGFLSKLFLDYGNTVYGVEPNEHMREAAENYLSSYPNFKSVKGSAETTTLSDHTVDFVTAGTAFHWFDAKKSKLEFKRILKSSGWVVLVWNVRNIEQSKLIADYEDLIRDYGTDYTRSLAQEFDKTLTEEFFSPNKMHLKVFPYRQYFDWQGFKGRLLSSSYSLRPNDSRYEDMLKELKNIFDRYQQQGQVEFLYETKVYYGIL